MPREEPGDDSTSGPPPHPLDRPWVHPSEMSARARQAETRERGSRRRRDLGLVLAAGTIGALVVIIVLAATGMLDGDSTTTQIRAADSSADPDAAARIAATAGRSVVAILVTPPEAPSEAPTTTPAASPQRASGVHLSDGRVITSLARVGDATAITVVTADGTNHPATVQWRDPVSGLAVLRMNASGVSTAHTAARSVQTGQWVVAVGGGDGRSHWVTTGVVASNGGWTEDASGTPRAGMIGTDAMLPPESWGGALLDKSGDVVGILTGATKDGRGLVTPVAVARDIVEQTAEHGKIEHGGLGVMATDGDGGGAVVVAIVADSPAAKAGLRKDDTVRAIDETRVAGSASLVYEVRRRRPGQVASLTIVRSGRRRIVRVTLGTTKADPVTSQAGAITAVAPG